MNYEAVSQTPAEALLKPSRQNAVGAACRQAVALPLPQLPRSLRACSASASWTVLSGIAAASSSLTASVSHTSRPRHASTATQ